MRAAHQLVHSRTRVRPRYALMPLEGFPASRLPTWPDAQVRVLASPALGAGFVQYLIDLPAGRRGEFPADPAIETFFFVLDGLGIFTDGAGEKIKITEGSYGLTPPGLATHLAADEVTKLLVLRKRFEPAPG